MIDKIIKVYSKMAAPVKKNWQGMSPEMKSAVKFGAIAGIPLKVAIVGGAYYAGKSSDKTTKVVDQELTNKIYNQGVIRGANNVAQRLDKQMSSMKPGHYIAGIRPHDPKRFKKKK
jgi:hypothetical protein